jgi:hypothetical protein
MAMNKSNFRWTAVLAFFAAITLVSAPTLAQVTQIDPDAAIDGDLTGGNTPSAPAPASAEVPGSAGNGTPNEAGVETWDPAEISAEPQAPAATTAGTEQTANADAAATYRKDDLLGAAEGIFGTGSQGLASIIEDILSKQGEPSGYIVGREGGGAFVVGLRYGSGALYHKVEGNRPVY